MSKKSKRHFRDTSKIASGNVTATVIAQKGGEFDPDYSDVVKDLKRIGILALVFFAILIALSFVL
jgi:hypothetical protein